MHSGDCYERTQLPPDTVIRLRLTFVSLCPFRTCFLDHHCRPPLSLVALRLACWALTRGCLAASHLMALRQPQAVPCYPVLHWSAHELHSQQASCGTGWVKSPVVQFPSAQPGHQTSALTSAGCFLAAASGVRLLGWFGFSAFLMSKASSPSA